MKVIGSYWDEGCALLKGLVPVEVAQAFLQSLKQDLGPGPLPARRPAAGPNFVSPAALELYGHQYKPMLLFLWGLTPAVSRIVGRELLPTYDFLRIYTRGDVSQVHCERYSCEHSLSLTLGYSDGRPWALQVAKARSEPSSRVDPDFGPEPHSSIEAEVGDAVLYQGLYHRHGRTIPNPNRWSAHLLFHWVERDGPNSKWAFDGQIRLEPVDFAFS
ncbi:MAG TPA: hypothetical protein VEW26_00490 [Allosphingosinicella sp.]|nr:hypothetical protein [Allosphingosinicella sp.]